MKSYLLDTNVVSEVRKPKPHGGLLSWMAGLRAEQMFISAVTLGELQAGVERTRKQDEKKAAEIENWVEQIASTLQVLPMDGACFRLCSRMMVGKPEEIFEDGMIAATAAIHGLTIATRNQRDFAHFPVEVLNPFRGL